MARSRGNLLSICLEVVCQGSDGRFHEKDEFLADLFAVVLTDLLGGRVDSLDLVSELVNFELCGE